MNHTIVNQLFKKFPRRPQTLDERNLRLLADFIVDDRGISLANDRLVFRTMDPASPFREILLAHIHGVADLGADIAIVLHSTIIFLNRHTLRSRVYIRPVRRGFLRKLLSNFRKC